MNGGRPGTSGRSTRSQLNRSSQNTSTEASAGAGRIRMSTGAGGRPTDGGAGGAPEGPPPPADERRQAGDVRPVDALAIEPVVPEHIDRSIGRGRADQDVNGVGGDVGILAERRVAVGRVEEQ